MKLFFFIACKKYPRCSDTNVSNRGRDKREIMRAHIDDISGAKMTSRIHGRPIAMTVLSWPSVRYVDSFVDGKSYAISVRLCNKRPA